MAKKNLLDVEPGGVLKALAASNKPALKKVEKNHIRLIMLDPNSTPVDENGNPTEDTTLRKSLLNVLNGGKGNSIQRLAFETDPTEPSEAATGIYVRKLRLLPDDILKRIAIQDNLVAAIIIARAHHIATFGRKQPDRFSTGFKIVPLDGLLDKMSPEQKKKFEEDVDKAERLLTTCGHTEHFDTRQRHMTFSQQLSMLCRNALTVGRIAVEVIWVIDPQTNKKKFHAFRPVDAGTIYQCINDGSQAEDVRREARKLLEEVRRKQFKKEPQVPEHFDWVQVVHGKPIQVFTDTELMCKNFYPVTDIELDGYPVTPLDTVMNAVTTHLNIEEHNKLYFQSGRAARGMILIQSDDVDEGVVQNIKQEFQASINSVQNAWRMPVFGLGKEDQITWTPIDSGTRDMEFQYLSDSNARTILSAFQMSPEELPGYAHLSRGTNSQALSESNNEYKVEAARDVGIRPLLSGFEDFINARIFPLIAPELAKICTVKLLGLDAETAEKESVRIQQDMGLHMNYDEVLAQVEKKPVGLEWGGQFPLNPAVQQVLLNYLTFGQILERFFGVKDASKDPQHQWYQNPAWMQWQQMQMQQQQAQQQQEAQAQQAQQPQPGDQDGDVSKGLDQAIKTLSKGEASNLPPSRRKLYAQQQKVVKDTMREWDEQQKAAIAEIVATAEKYGPKK